MEEQQIQHFVQRVANDETLQHALARDPQAVIRQQGFTPTVAEVVLKLVPHLSFEQEIGPAFNWWAG